MIRRIASAVPAAIRLPLVCGIISLYSCAPSGYVLHVDNRASVPYTAVNERLKQRVLRSLVRHRLITEAQRVACEVNIMQIDQSYLVEVWPDGISSQKQFSLLMTRPFLRPGAQHGAANSTGAAGGR